MIVTFDLFRIIILTDNIKLFEMDCNGFETWSRKMMIKYIDAPNLW